MPPKRFVLVPQHGYAYITPDTPSDIDGGLCTIGLYNCCALVIKAFVVPDCPIWLGLCHVDLETDLEHRVHGIPGWIERIAECAASRHVMVQVEVVYDNKISLEGPGFKTDDFYGCYVRSVMSKLNISELEERGVRILPLVYEENEYTTSMLHRVDGRIELQSCGMGHAPELAAEGAVMGAVYYEIPSLRVQMQRALKVEKMPPIRVFDGLHCLSRSEIIALYGELRPRVQLSHTATSADSPS